MKGKEHVHGSVKKALMARKKKVSRPGSGGKSLTEFYIILDALSANIAVLDEKGVIVHTNRAWQRFAKANGLAMTANTLGVNYLDICRSAKGPSSDKALDAARGIRKVLSQDLREFLMEYPCHSQSKRRWFHMRVTPIGGNGDARLIVSHENISEVKRAEEKLRVQEERLRMHAKELEESNIALKVLLKHREQDRKDLEHKVLSNLKERVLPYLDRLKRSPLNPSQKEMARLIEAHLHEVTSPFSQNLSVRFKDLTPREIQVAGLIKDGKTTKEIADILNLSTRAVEFHRDHIREKFGLRGRKANLRSFLLTLS